MRVISILTAILCGLILTACGSDEPESSSAPAEQTKTESGAFPVTIEHKYGSTFRVQAEELYEIRDGFPRLTARSFPEGVPPGVDSISYTLNLAACAEWLLEKAPGATAKGIRAGLAA